MEEIFLFWVFRREVKRPGREADHSHLMTRLRMHGAIPPLLNTSSWRGIWWGNVTCNF